MATQKKCTICKETNGKHHKECPKGTGDTGKPTAIEFSKCKALVGPSSLLKVGEVVTDVNGGNGKLYGPYTIVAVFGDGDTVEALGMRVTKAEAQNVTRAAQSSQSADNDRIAALESKLDKLINALG